MTICMININDTSIVKRVNLAVKGQCACCMYDVVNGIDPGDGWFNVCSCARVG